MAILTFSSKRPTSPFAKREPFAKGTNPEWDEEDDRRPGALPLVRAPDDREVDEERDSNRTRTKVLRSEQGDEDQVDQTTGEESLVEPLRPIGAFIDERCELAHRLERLVQRMLDNHGKVRMAADVQLLRRELSRGHDILGSSRRESNYLSIVTLVEAALSDMDWKTVTTQQLREIRNAVSIGYSDADVTFEAFDHVSRVFRTSGLRTMPPIDFTLEEADSDEF